MMMIIENVIYLAIYLFRRSIELKTLHISMKRGTALLIKAQS